MARIVGKLKARQVINVKPPKGRRAVVLGDGGNLYLEATVGAEGNIRRSWLFKYELVGKRREMGLGPLHTVSLVEARALARDLRQQLLKNIDPLAEKQKARQTLEAERAKAITFKAVADLYMDAFSDGWSRRHAEQWSSSLKAHVFPRIGGMAVADVDTGAVMRCVEPIWKTRTTTASRVRSRIELILGFATARGWRTGDNPARWRGLIKNLLPATKALKPVVEHHAAMNYTDLPAFMAELRERDGIVAKALAFVILTAARADEVIGMDWGEIDFANRTWTRPANRMKNRIEHKVPLSDSAVAILKSLKPHSHGRVFPRSRDLMRRLLQRMRPDMEATTHGMRASFRTWAAERTSYPADIAEQALAHVVGDATRRAYERTDQFAKRARLMQQWSDYLAKPVAQGEVVPLAGRG
jgi:integrase